MTPPRVRAGYKEWKKREKARRAKRDKLLGREPKKKGKTGTPKGKKPAKVAPAVGKVEKGSFKAPSPRRRG